MVMPFTMSAATDDSGRRLDRVLRKALPDLPLSAIHRLLRKGAVLVDGKAAPPDYRVRPGEKLVIDPFPPDLSRPVPHAAAPREWRKLPKKAPSPAPGGLEILFEGRGLLVLNKPRGLPVHGRRSLEDLALAYLAPKLEPSLSFRPGPLHRLDRPSSGVIAFSSSLEGARFFSALMKTRKIKKYYLALVEGRIEKDEVWEDDLIRDEALKKSFTIGLRNKTGRASSVRAGPPALRQQNPAPQEGKAAATRVKPVAGNAEATLVLAEIETGRTHQIRVQAAARGHPLLGDKKYGAKTARPGRISESAPRQNRGRAETQATADFFLHAWRMELPEAPPLPAARETPETEGGRASPLVFQAPLPGYFREMIRGLFTEEIFQKLKTLFP